MHGVGSLCRSFPVCSAAAEGPVCLVAGASRGLGRGIARALGEIGATVIVTGRSTEVGTRTEGRGETIEDTARLVDAAGGNGVPYRCDHTNAQEVESLVGWTLRRHGRIDLAVSAVWGGNEGFDGERYRADGSVWGTPFWRRGSGGSASRSKRAFSPASCSPATWRRKWSRPGRD